MVISQSGLYASGVVREIIAPVNFDFDGLTGSQSVIVAEHVDIRTLQEACFVTRFFSGSIAGSGTITVLFKSDGWTPEDPTSLFLPTFGAVAPAATAGGLLNPQPPLLVLSTVTSGAGPLVTIEVVGSPNGACHALMSIDLVAKGGTSFGNADGYNTFIGFPPG